MAKILNTSRLQFAKLFKVGNVQYWGNRPLIAKTPRPDDRFHTVILGDRIDLLSHRYLADVSLWWIIADYNDLFFCGDLEIGMVLRIPEISTVQLEIL